MLPEIVSKCVTQRNVCDPMYDPTVLYQWPNSVHKIHYLGSEGAD